jgi:arsenate reductase-like glutaredoxin family protein
VLINPKSTALKAVGADLSSLTAEQAAELLSANPKAMYRPLLSDGRRLVIGFKPEEMSSLV